MAKKPYLDDWTVCYSFAEKGTVYREPNKRKDGGEEEARATAHRILCEYPHAVVWLENTVAETQWHGAFPRKVPLTAHSLQSSIGAKGVE